MAGSWHSEQSGQVETSASILAEQLAYYRTVANEYEQHSIEANGIDELLTALCVNVS